MKIKIIAEAGVNHNGSLKLAKEMVAAAKDAGADYIKFQTFQPDKLVSKYAGKAEYQKEATGTEESQLEMLQKLALGQDDFCELQAYCNKMHIGFLSTPFDLESIQFLDTLNMDFWKLPSGEITNLPYLKKIAETKRPVVMSTGMCTMEEVLDTVALFRDLKVPGISLLHCNTEYPTPMEDVNLAAMLTLKRICNLPVGYSDHTQGIEIPIAAAALGASILEKHFTLNKKMEGPDHRASLEPNELKAMIGAVRNIEKAIGNGEKTPSCSEIKNRAVARKSIVAKRAIRSGELFTEENLTAKRPGTGISPMHWYEILGKTAYRDFEEDEIIQESK